MNLPDLLYSLTIAGLKMKLGPGGAIDIIGPTKKLTDDQRQGVRENRSQIVTLLGCFTQSNAEIKRDAIEPYGAIQFGSHWISAEDHQYLTTSPPQDPCPWCGCRTTHALTCITLSDDWALKMTFGKHKGIPIRDIDQGYLKWVLRKKSTIELSDEVLTEIENVLQARKNSTNCEPEPNCRVEGPEQAEREAIEFAETEEAKLQAFKVGDEFILMAARDHHTWLWNKIGEQESIADLEAFAERVEKEIEKFAVYRPIADDIRELIANRKILLYDKTNEPGDANHAGSF